MRFNGKNVLAWLIVLTGITLFVIGMYKLYGSGVAFCVSGFAAVIIGLVCIDVTGKKPEESDA